MAKDPARRLTGEQATASLTARSKTTRPTATVSEVPAAPPRPARPVTASGRRSATVLPLLAVLALIGAALPLKAFLPRLETRPSSYGTAANPDYVLVHQLLDLNRLPHAGPTGTPFWLWLLPTVLALTAAAAMPSRVPSAARLPGIVGALILPIRLLADAHRLSLDYLRATQAPALMPYIRIDYGPGWWLLVAASVTAPVVLLVQYLSARRAGR